MPRSQIKALVALEAPVLFVQGSRDALCPLDLMEGVRERMRARNTLHVVLGGDHSLIVPRSRAADQTSSDQAVLEAIRVFAASLGAARGT
jgi:fermentation-respiration switch protein FrsA (DUF1100 family)